MSSLSTYFKRVFTEYLNDPASDDEIDAGNIDESISPTWTSEHTFAKGALQTASIPDGETVTVGATKAGMVGGTYEVTGDLVVDGSLTTTGPVIGSGSITGSGAIASTGTVTDSVEPIAPTIDNNTYVMVSGWTTDNDTNSYEAYRWQINGSLEVGSGEALTFERQ